MQFLAVYCNFLHRDTHFHEFVKSIERKKKMDNELNEDDLLKRPDPSFVPTLNEPMPTYRCTKVKRDGERCKNIALRGMLPDNAKCPAHGGKAPGVIEAAENRKDAVRLALLSNTDLAVQTIESLMAGGVSDAVRLKAATEVLDRTIGKSPIEVNVTENVTVNAAEKLLEQLARLAENDTDTEESDES